MKCIILAAGASTRLQPLTASIPKCLLTVGRHTILERAIQGALRRRISDFVIVTGFQSRMIISFVREKFPSLKVEFIPNEKFAETNNGYSLALAEPAMRGSQLILLDSDIVFDERILSDLLSSAHDNCLAVRTDGEFEDEDVKVRVDDKGRILQIGKDLDRVEILGESLGIEKFSQDSAARLFEILMRRTIREGREGEFYEASFQELIDAGSPIYAVDAKDYPCIEIDTVDDLRRAREEIAPKLEKV